MVTSFSKAMRTNEKKPRGWFVCAADATGHLLLGQFPGPPCWDGRAGGGGGPWALLGHTEHGRDRHRAPAFKAWVRCAEQEHRESWHCLKQSWGLAGESTAETNSRNLNRVRQLIQHGCGGEHKHPALESSRRQWWLWKEEGREIPSYRHRAGKAVSCESRRGLDRMSRERVQTKLPPTRKVREHENVGLIRWGLAYTQRSEQLAWSWE